MPHPRTPGASLAQAQRRLTGYNLGLPRLLNEGADSGSTNRPNFTLTSGGSSNTYGSYVELASAISEDAGFMLIEVTNAIAQSATSTGTVLDIATGAAASEVVVIQALNCGFMDRNATELAYPRGWMIPIFIPRGSRIAARIKSTVVSKVITVRCHYFAPFEGIIPSKSLIGMGISGLSGGTAITAPGAINTEGAWTEIISATAEPFAGLVMGFGGVNDTTQSNARMLVDIGMGASGSEIEIIRNVAVFTTTTEQVTAVSPLVHPAIIPAGTRLAARYQYNVSGSSLDITLHGIRPAA